MKDSRYIRAIGEGLAEELNRDENVLVLGEDVVEGGPFSVTKGLADRFGTKRIRNTPISESAFMGLALGAAIAGLRPVVEVMFMDFLTVCMDPLVNHAAKMRYMFGGQYSVPLVVLTAAGAGGGAGPHHSQSLEAWFAHIPGLKVVMPSTPYDAKGLLKAAIRDNDPVAVMEGELLYNVKGEVPDDDDFIVPLGVADRKRKGDDVSIITHGRMVHIALQAAGQLAKEGIEADVLDLRSLRPLDVEAILETVSRTHRAVYVEDGFPYVGIGSQIVSILMEEAFDNLDAPVLRVTQADIPMPYNKKLEAWTKPSAGRVVEACKRVLYVD